ncbi:hypothetical protein [Helicobacter ailurogastricus]|uniref:Transglycosylase SLT domain-containing protein n=1 Tax=Helicobacter ailurogastricus TaxID=1578720 RepID=A0A0K2X8J0_9HELI|nr:hypothetical protein [Helicobacter ailurogastricus]CRF41513.1 FIG00710594: hypothetical protein [Helicobacter ailurogastricus]CRF42981.1 FIG00710594: hypothetical protein [Helicobacter ailurogastricus]CRF43710.1 FIG00710594: hypothetical protein [Helicobacter ailurogastricus]
MRYVYKAVFGLWRSSLWALLAFVCLSNSLSAGHKEASLAECIDPRHFNAFQKRILVYAYRYGFKENLGYELAAIAWKESCAGMYRVDFSDPSAGIYHAYIPDVLKRYNERDTRFMQSVYGDLLIKDQNFASKVALDTLISWKRIHKGDLKDMIKSYHKGLRWQKNEHIDQSANEYYQDILTKIKTLQSMMPALEKSVDEDQATPLQTAKHEHKDETIQAQPQLELQPQIVSTSKPRSQTRRKPRPHKSAKHPTHHATPKPPESKDKTHTGKTPKNSKDANEIILMQESPVF